MAKNLIGVNNLSELLGFASYCRKYIKGFAQIVKPVNDLLWSIIKQNKEKIKILSNFLDLGPKTAVLSKQ